MADESFRKVIAKGAVPVEMFKKGHSYFIDRRTGDIVETDMTSPEYQAYKKAKDQERKVKEAELKKKRAERKKERLAKIEEKQKKLAELKESLLE